MALGCIVLGLVMLARRKGTPWHRRAGRVWLGAMIVMNLSALTVFRDSDGFAVFHYLAFVSLATILIGYATIRWARRGPARVPSHGIVMSWAIAGLIAAGAGQGAAWLESPVGLTILVALFMAALAIHTKRWSRFSTHRLR